MACLEPVPPEPSGFGTPPVSAGNYKRILAVSAEVKLELLVTYAIPENKITVIHNGVDEKRFHLGLRDKFRALMRKQWRIPSDVSYGVVCGKRFPAEGLGSPAASMAVASVERHVPHCCWR